jgi:hypothetical protein
VASNKVYYFSGKAKYRPWLTRPDVEYKNWNVVLYLDEKSLQTFRALKDGEGNLEGIMNHLNQDEDGWFATFKRPTHKEWKGKEEALLPPVVLDANGIPWQSELLIGAGSDITVKCEWYSFNKPFKKGARGSAIRMVSARIDNLVPFEQNRDFTDGEKKLAEGLAEQPKQLF